MFTPSRCDVVLPNHPIPMHDVASVESIEQSGERVVRDGASVVRGDRGLERLSLARIAELRHRLESGSYNSPHVMNELAMRLLESGDL